jgi:glucose/arabinose dehydrogenase
MLFGLLVTTGACKKKNGPPAAGPGPEVAGAPVETQAPNAPAQRPAFAGQTRAPFRPAGVAFDTQVVAKGLEHPWSLAFLPDGAMLVTERPGRLRIVGADGALSEPVTGVPVVDARDQGGLLDVALDPDFATNHTIWLSFAERAGDVRDATAAVAARGDVHGPLSPAAGDTADGDANGTALARAVLVRDAGGPARLDGLTVVWRQTPKLVSTMHFGGRILFDRSGALLLTLGERSILEGRAQAQRLDGTLGKVVRINRDGTIPLDNPFAQRAGARPEIWSYGHRNIQAAAWQPGTGALFTIEHGARGGDEVNVVERGKDYGWPTITYGIEYAGGPIGDGITQHEGMEQPIYYWDPVIAPSGATFYTGDAFPAWKGSLLVGALAGKHVARLALDGRKVIGEERLLAGRSRIRDVRTGPDGFLYLLTDEDDGELLRLVPAAAGATAQR